MKTKTIQSVFLNMKYIIAVLFLLMLLMAMFSLSVSAQTNDKSKVVRVGWFDSSYNIITINNLRNYPKIYRYALWLYICIFQYWYMFFKRLSCGQ